jgi:hypothetical protein
MIDLNELINDLPLKVDGESLKIWREKGNSSWDIAYNVDGNNLKEIVWEQGRTLLDTTQKMLEKLKSK